MDKIFSETGRLFLCTRIGLFSLKIRKFSLLQNQEGLAALLYEEAYIFKLHILV